MIETKQKINLSKILLNNVCVLTLIIIDCFNVLINSNM